MRFWKEKRKLCIIAALTALLISAGLIWAGRRSSELSVSTEEICSNLSSQSSFSFIKTSLHKTIRGTVEEDTIKFTYLSEPTEALQAAAFDPDTGKTDLQYSEYHIRQEDGWLFCRYKDGRWEESRPEEFSPEDFLKRVSFSIAGVDLAVIDKWNYVRTEELGERKARLFKGTCPVEEYLKAKTELAGYKYFGVSDQSGDLGEIEAEIWNDKDSDEVLKLRYDITRARKQYQEGMGIDVTEVTLSDEIVPFALPEEL